MSKIKAKEITQEQLIRILQASKQDGSSLKYGFILGAGASIKSNIPSGSELANKWYKEIKEDISKEAQKKWEKEIPNFDEKKLAEFYTKIFVKRFEADYQAGYEELQRYMDKAEPSIGYSFLAQILAETQNKFVITTNFDTMVEDALFGLKKSKPLVLGHELLSKYINPVSPSRPTIIKIHRDFLFDPYNKDEEIEKLDKQWEESLKPVLNENAMIVIGYGGNDDSLMNYLKDIKNRKPIYWCYRDEKNLSTKITELLEEKDFIIKIKGFDKFMLTLNDKLEFNHIIDKEKIEDSTIVRNALNYARKYEKQLEELGKEDLDKEEEKAIKKLLPSWWEYEQQVLKEINNEKKEKIYLEGLIAHPNSYELMTHYAILLSKMRRYKEAEEFYLKALKNNPNHPIILESYALFFQITHNYKKAEEYYLKVLEIDSNQPSTTQNYANLLRKLLRYNEAEKYYLKALELDSMNAINHGNYAIYLKEVKRYKEAEKYYLKALELNSTNANNHGNYAQLLLIQGKKKESEIYIKKAFENLEDENDLEIELWFYRLAHFPDYFKEAQEKIEELLKKGIKSVGWDFSANIEQSKKEDHKDIPLLEKYAKLITKE